MLYVERGGITQRDSKGYVNPVEYSGALLNECFFDITVWLGIDPTDELTTGETYLNALEAEGERILDRGRGR